jgi:hypothetical protein
VLNNLILKINEIISFTGTINPLNLTDATGIQLAQLNSELQTLVTQLGALNPSVNVLWLLQGDSTNSWLIPFPLICIPLSIRWSKPCSLTI